MGSERRIPAAECTEYPWWAIIDPDVVHGLFSKRQRVLRAAAAITGPFLSRAEAEAQLARRRYAYGPDAVVYSLSGHDSAEWRALCHEDPASQGATTRAEAAEQRAEAAEDEVSQLRADRAVATVLAVMAMGPDAHEVLPAGRGHLLTSLRARCLSVLPQGAQSDDVAAYVRAMCERMLAEAQRGGR